MKIDPKKDYRLTVIADTNDADYVHRIEKFTGKEIIDHVLPIIEQLKTCKEHYNWWAMWDRHDDKPKPIDIYDLTEDQISWFEDCCKPWGEGGTHSIDQILISEWVDETKLFPDRS